MGEDEGWAFSLSPGLGGRGIKTKIKTGNIQTINANKIDIILKITFIFHLEYSTAV
jgi:hypothetical protein